MPEQKTIRRAQRDKAKGNSTSTQAGEYVREEIDHIREGKHGAKNAKQAIAIGLSKARRAGVKLAAPKKGKASAQTRAKAETDLKKGSSRKKTRTSPKRSAASTRALKGERKSAVSKTALSRQAKSAARKRGPVARKSSAQKAARTRKRTAKS